MRGGTVDYVLFHFRYLGSRRCETFESANEVGQRNLASGTMHVIIPLDGDKTRTPARGMTALAGQPEHLLDEGESIGVGIKQDLSQIVESEGGRLPVRVVDCCSGGG